MKTETLNVPKPAQTRNQQPIRTKPEIVVQPKMETTIRTKPEIIPKPPMETPKNPSYSSNPTMETTKNPSYDGYQTMEPRNSNIAAPNQNRTGPQDFDLFDDDDDEFFRNIPIDELMAEATAKKEVETPEMQMEETQVIVKEEEHSISGTNTHNDGASKFIQLIDIFHELSQPEANNIVVKQFRIKGMIVKFNSKLGIVKEGNRDNEPRWNLEVLLTDGSASVSCLLDDGFLAGRIGLSARRFEEMKTKQLLAERRQAIDDFQENIRGCNFGVFTLLLSDNCDKLVVVEHLPLDSDATGDLQRRITEMEHR